MVRVSKVARCPFPDAAYFVEPFFGEHLSSSPLGSLTASVRVRREASCALERVSPAVEALEICWAARSSLLSTWYGVLTIAPHHDGAMLDLQICHGATKSAIGAVIDAVLDRCAAQRAAEQLLDEISAEVTMQWFVSRFTIDVTGADVARRYAN